MYEMRYWRTIPSISTVFISGKIWGFMASYILRETSRTVESLISNFTGDPSLRSPKKTGHIPPHKIHGRNQQSSFLYRLPER